MWCMRRTNIYLSESQTETLDALAERQGISRSEVVRQLIDAGLSRGPISTARITAITESFGVLRDIYVPERGQSERDQHLDRLWHL